MGLHSSSHAHRTNYLQYHRLGRKGAMENLEGALQATRSLLKNKPPDAIYEATMNPSGSRRPRNALNLALNILKTNFSQNIVTSLSVGLWMRPPRFSCASRTANAPSNICDTFMWLLGSGLVTLLYREHRQYSGPRPACHRFRPSHLSCPSFFRLTRGR